MRILIPFSYYHPEQCSGLFVIDDMTEMAANLGISSIVTVPTPTRNVKHGVKWNKNETLYNGKVKVHRFRMFKERNNTYLRAFRYLMCEIVQLHYMIWKKYDVAFIDSTPPIQGLKLPLVKFFRRKPIVYNAQDLFPETLSGSGITKNGSLLWKIGLWVSRVTFKYSDKIIAISYDIKNSMVARGVPEEKIEVIYNWVDTDAVHPVKIENNPLFEEFGIDKDKFRVVYAGNLGNAQNINIILDAASKLKERNDIQFIVFGSGGLEDEIRKRVETEGLTNMRLLPLQPIERVSEVYSLGDIDIVSCKAGLGGSAMPSKTWSILSTGTPVLANFDEGELKMILENNRCGVFTKADDIDGFVDAIEYLSKHREECRQMGANGREFIIHNLTKEVGTKKYIEVIKSVVNKVDINNHE